MRINFLVISVSILIFVLTAIVLRKRGNADDAKKRMIKSITDEGNDLKSDHAELEESFYSRFIEDKVKKVSKLFEQYANKRKEKNNQVVNEKKVAKIQQTERLLRMSGMHTSYQNFNFFKIAFAIIFSVVVVGVAFVLNLELINTMLIIMIGIVVAFMAPDFFLKNMVKSHQQKIRDQLPDVFDLLAVCIGAGLSFDNALLKVIEKMEGPFIDELMTVFRQMQMGVSRVDALSALSDCTDIPELKTFVSAVVQASQLGIPINNVMKVQSQQLRDTRRETAKERGNKAAVKMSLPIMIFIFPALFIVILGPTVINVMNSMH